MGDDMRSVAAEHHNDSTKVSSFNFIGENTFFSRASGLSVKQQG
jgi:hypothetical protein